MPQIAAWPDRLPWQKTRGAITAHEVLRGSTGTGLTVTLATAPAKPTLADLDALWKARARGSSSPVLVLTTYPTGNGTEVAVAGPDRDSKPRTGLAPKTIDQAIDTALRMDSPVRLAEHIRDGLTTADTLDLGVRSEGLLASYVLFQQPSRDDWAARSDAAAHLLTARGEELLTGLGYHLDRVPDGLLLRAEAGEPGRAAALLLLNQQSPDRPLPGSLAGSTAVMSGLAVARQENVPWLIVLSGPVARLYPVSPDVGVGRKGQTQTFLEVNLGKLNPENAAYLTLLLSPEALAVNGTVAGLLAESGRYATGLSERLRDRIYQDVIPALAVAVAVGRGITRLPKAQQRAALDDAYHQAMIILFRLLFVAYGEDRGLLPMENKAYRANALKTLADRILDDPDAGFSSTSTSYWADLIQVWDVIDAGDLEGMGVPAYNGGLFTRDPVKNPLGAGVYDLRLTNADIGPVLRGLMIDITPDGILGLVDFRSLDVREFGTIYEGLLESGLGIAASDLTLDKTDTYVPATKGDLVTVPAGGVYFHSRSGTRKASGSYFTKPFAVQHLLEQALEPALDAHLGRVEALLAKKAYRSAAEALFDFRVADLSMGSAHFLVAAIDRIEARFTAFLTEHPMPEVLTELQTLRETAATQLRKPPAESGIDDSALLRRQIARRCIYGIDINEIAVELARLAIWIHTFVPGLPLSFLNHGLIHGNSLTGVGTLDEITQALDSIGHDNTKSSSKHTPASTSTIPIEDFLARAGQHLDRLAALADTTIADVETAARLQEDIADTLTPLTALCDLIAAERATLALKKTDPDKIQLSASQGLLIAADLASVEEHILKHPHLARARQLTVGLGALHLPAVFPEVFRRERPGFDVILGNPPWEKAKVEEHSWWAVRFPGLKGMSQEDKNAAIVQYRKDRPDLVTQYEAEVRVAKDMAAVLVSGPYPGIGAGDIDLCAAFCWRFWLEVRDGGTIGVVLPRTAMSGSITSTWRHHVLTGGSITDLTTLTNRAGWAFEGIDQRWSVALLTVTKATGSHAVTMRGPFTSAEEFAAGKSTPGATIPAATLLSWSKTASIPLIPATDLPVYAAMKEHPALGDPVGTWQFRPLRELDATKEKRFYEFDLKDPAPDRSLPVWTGSSFNLWNPGFGDPYAYANPADIEAFLQDKRANQIRLKSSAFYGRSEEWAADPGMLPMRHPRIAFRDITNRTNRRTTICALVPPDVALVHRAPYLLRLAGSNGDEAYILGVLSSIPFDWIARRTVEIALTLSC